MSEPTLADVIRAAERADWAQVVMNGGPPCFHLETDGKFCLRAQRWEGHKVKQSGGGLHPYLPLDGLLQLMLQSVPQGARK